MNTDQELASLKTRLETAQAEMGAVTARLNQIVRTVSNTAEDTHSKTSITLKQLAKLKLEPDVVDINSQKTGPKVA